MERHPLDSISLTAGLVFTLAAVFGLTGAITLGITDLRWIGPALLVLFGVVLVATSVSRRGDEPTEATVAAGAAGAAGDDRTERSRDAG
ncbi:MAG: hypothetical protein R6V28_15325 [Nitriliruptoraceae bacterium]